MGICRHSCQIFIKLLNHDKKRKTDKNETCLLQSDQIVHTEIAKGVYVPLHCYIQSPPMKSLFTKQWAYWPAIQKFVLLHLGSPSQS